MLSRTIFGVDPQFVPEDRQEAFTDGKRRVSDYHSELGACTSCFGVAGSGEYKNTIWRLKGASGTMKRKGCRISMFLRFQYLL